MNLITQLRERIFPAHLPIPSGLYPYTSTPDEQPSFHLQLRIETNGLGLLILNGSTVLHLNQTAAEYMYHFISRTPMDTISKTVSKRYGIAQAQVSQDFTDLIEHLKNLIATPDLDPVTYLDFDQTDLYSGAISAPYRLDCALTYQTTEANSAHYAPLDRVKRELDENEWQIILKKAWDVGIPHVVFTGGEPTLRPDLVKLITYASSLGLVTGVISQGARLSDPHYLHEILQSGLDHLMLILDPDEEQNWEALRDMLVEDLALTVHLTLTPKNTFEDGKVFEKLESMGVSSISISAADISLKEQLLQAHQMLAQHSMHLVWDLPVPYSKLHPVALEMEDVEKPPRGAGVAWLYVEPDGDVLRTQGEPEVLGNFLTSSWAEIWQSHG